MLRRWRRHRQADLRDRLAEDARRTVGFMAAVLTDARHLGVEVDDALDACVVVWRHWADRVTEWGKGRDD